MYRNFDDSHVLVSGPFWNLASPPRLILAATIFWGVIAAAAPARAAFPTDPNQPYIGVYAGDVGPEYDKLITTRFDAEDGSYLLSAFNDAGNPHGESHSSARVSEARYEFNYLNPDLHASVSGEAKSVGDLSGSVDATVNASFRDILTIKGLPPGASSYPFVIVFTYEGTMAGSGDKGSASRGWANVAINFSLSDVDQPDKRDFSGTGLSTLPIDEAPGGYLSGRKGRVSGPLEMLLNVEAGAHLMIEGSIDMYGNATGGDASGAIFKADFSNSVTFGGIHIYTDDTLTTELTGYTIESAFGFDYRVNVVPEPATLTQLAIVGVMFGALRRKLRRAAAIATSSNPDRPIC